MNVRVQSVECSNGGEQPHDPRPSTFGPRHSSPGFTLVEVMVVGAIIVLIMTASIPSLAPLLKREGFRKVVDDVMQVCAAARAQAIIHGKTAEVTFYPYDKRCAGGGKSAEWGGNVTLVMLGINLLDYTEADIATVRFFPDGRCDEMILGLEYSTGKSFEVKTLFTEVTTGLVSAEEGAGHLGR